MSVAKDLETPKDVIFPPGDLYSRHLQKRGRDVALLRLYFL